MGFLDDIPLKAGTVATHQELNDNQLLEWMTDYKYIFYTTFSKKLDLASLRQGTLNPKPYSLQNFMSV